MNYVRFFQALLLAASLCGCSDDDAGTDASVDAAFDGNRADAPGDADDIDSSGTDSGDIDAADATTAREIVLSSIHAFPSAEGAGSITTGGRGGRVVHVQNLDDDGPGSFREAMRAEGARTIVFDVSGRIQLSERIELVRADGDLTIAGETAPEGGITLSGKPILLGGGYDRGNEPADNVIIRHVRFRNGSYTGVADEFDHNALISTGTDRFIFDHASFSFNDDQAISMNSNYGPVRDGTIQRCLFSENATGIILGAGVDPAHPTERLSVLHNLFVHQSHRTPNIAHDGRFDVINNVLFNWGSRLTNVNTGSPQVNYIGNHLSPRRGGPRAVNKVQDSVTLPSIFTAYNFHPELYPAPELDDRDLWTDFASMEPADDRFFTTTQHPLLAATVVETADEARADVLADFGTNAFVSDAGMTGRYLDSYDTERLADVVDDVSRDPDNKVWIQPVLPSVTRPAGFYGALADIPAFFADAHGITANDNVIAVYDFGDYRVRNDAGYSAFEMYLFYAAGDFDRLR